MPQKFWMVWGRNIRTTGRRYPTLDEACVEADRVARQTENIGKKVYVLESIDYRWVAPVSLTYEKL